MGTFKISGELEINQYLTANQPLYLKTVASTPSINFLINNNNIAYFDSTGCLTINADPNTTAPYYRLYINGTSYFTSTMTTYDIFPRATNAWLGSSLLAWTKIYGTSYLLHNYNNSTSYGDLTISTTGTTSVTGVTNLNLGNATASGTANNAMGQITIYSNKTGSAVLKATTDTTSATTHQLPTSSGILLNSATYSSYALPLAGGTMTGTIITPADDTKGIEPATNNYGQIGSSTKKFYRMYATYFYGALKGNADTATSATTATTATNADNVYINGATTSTLYLHGSTSSAAGYRATYSNNSIYMSGTVLYGAAWNDYAEFRKQKEEIEAGYCVASTDNGEVYKTTEKFQACDGIVSDTFGYAIGKTDECKTPLAVAGRVLAYCEGDRYSYHSGDTVAAGPNGKVVKMTREEIKEYPDRVLGIVSEIPEYDTWGSGNINVNGRIWIKVR